MSEPIKCPYCGEKTVLAKILTQMYFLSEHPIHTGGVVMSGESMGEIIGEPSCEPRMTYSSFRCTSCEKKWFSHEYRLVKDENGILSFKQQRQAVKRKGRKSND